MGRRKLRSSVLTHCKGGGGPSPPTSEADIVSQETPEKQIDMQAIAFHLTY